jgi:hypothetical protein
MREKTADSRQQTADIRQQTADHTRQTYDMITHQAPDDGLPLDGLAIVRACVA